MRRVAGAFAAARLLTATLLVLFLGLALMAWAFPDALRVAAGWASAELALLARGPGEPTTPAKHPSTASEPGVRPAAPGKDARHRETGASAVDVGTLETRLRLLESSVSGPAGVEEKGGGEADEYGAENDGIDGALVPAIGIPEPGFTLAGQVAAWETIRGPLLRLLGSAAGRAGEDRQRSRSGRGSLEEHADITVLASSVVARLEELLARQAGEEKQFLAALDPSVLARLLADEHEVSELQAAEIFSRLSSREAREVLERLTRHAPARAARLLQSLLKQSGEATDRREAKNG